MGSARAGRARCSEKKQLRRHRRRLLRTNVACDASGSTDSGPAVLRSSGCGRTPLPSLGLRKEYPLAEFIQPSSTWEERRTNIPRTATARLNKSRYQATLFKAECSRPRTDLLPRRDSFSEPMRCWANNSSSVFTHKENTPQLQRAQSCPQLEFFSGGYTLGTSRSAQERLDLLVRFSETLLKQDLANLGVGGVRFNQVGPAPSASLAVSCWDQRLIFIFIWTTIWPTEDRKSGASCATKKRKGRRLRPWFSLKVTPLVDCHEIFGGEDASLVTRIENEIESTLINMEVPPLLEAGTRVIEKIAKNKIFRRPADLSDPNDILRSFEELTRCIATHKQDLTESIKNLLMDFSTESASQNSTLKAALKMAGVRTKKSRDDFDCFHRCVDLAERRAMEQAEVDLWEGNVSPPLQRCFEKPELGEEIESDGNCLVCFDRLDEVEEGFSLMRPCGHRICSVCLRGYLRSAAKSGESFLSCPAFRCPVTLGMNDLAHVLCSEGGPIAKKENNSADDDVLSRLVRFQFERTLFSVPEEERDFVVRNCPSPFCNHVFFIEPSGGGGEDCELPPGSNVHLCPCGSMLCGDCPEPGPPHLGLTCSQFALLRKLVDSGRLDAEAKSIEWVQRHSRPCPRCAHPIEKTDGCNHMRCAKCKYYFCWQCGGPGAKCRAFLCDNTGKRYTDDPDDEGEQGKAFQLVASYRGYSHAEKQLSLLQNEAARRRDTAAGNDGGCDTILALESQLRRVALWLHAFCVVNGPTPRIQGALEGLELVVHALSVRRLASQLGTTAAAIMTNQDGKITPKKRTAPAPTKRKKAPKWSGEKQRRAESPPPLRSILADQRLADLCEMGPDALWSAATRAALRCVQSLPPEGRAARETQPAGRRPPSVEAMNRKGLICIRRCRGGTVSDSVGDASLPPWKLGMTRVGTDEGEGGSLCGEMERVPWKGKALVEARRRFALRRAQAEGHG